MSEFERFVSLALTLRMYSIRFLPNQLGRTHFGLEKTNLSCGGLALGLFPDCRFEEGEVWLRHGDVLVAYTDGVTEAMNTRQEEFTEHRLWAAIGEASHQSAQEILNNILARVSAWSEGAPQHDDITAIVLKMA